MFKWDAERVAATIGAASAEGPSLEFKAALPDRSDKGKAEFLKDVSALANASGGAILFGVAEEGGRAESLAGLQLSDPDAEIRRLAQILESGVEPRIAGIQFAPLKLGESDVLVMDIPQSFDAPHRYVFNGHSKFVQRTETHVSELSYDQLRAAFDRSSSRLERLREDWATDVSLVNLWKPMVDGPVCVIRLSPLISADRRQSLDPKSAHERWSDLIFPGWGGGSSAYNFQGLAVFPGREDTLPAQVQVHRTGAISAYRTARILIDDRPLIPSTVVGEFFIEAANKLLEFIRSSGIAGSALINAGLVRLSRFQFAIPDRYGFEAAVESKHDQLLFPELWIDDLTDESIPVDELLRPAFDVLWQSYGLAGCPHFDDSGKWSLKHH